MDDQMVSQASGALGPQGGQTASANTTEGSKLPHGSPSGFLVGQPTLFRVKKKKGKIRNSSCNKDRVVIR